MVEHIREERGGKVLFNLQVSRASVRRQSSWSIDLGKASLVHHILKQYKSGNGPRLDVAQFVTHLQRAYGRIWREDIEASVLEGHLTTIVAAAVSSVEWWQQELDSRRFDVDFAMAQWLQTWLVWLLPAIPWNYWNYNQKPIKVLDDLLEEDFAQTMHGITSSLLAQVERNEVEESSQAGKAESGDH